VAFTLNDVGVKLLSGDYALHQVILTRASVAILLTLMFFIPLEGGFKNLRTKRLTMHLLRGLCVVIANMTFFLGLASLTLSEATAIFFIAPLAITALSVLILRETVGKQRWFAVLVGLVGVIVMLRPGIGTFNYAALLPLIAAFAYATLQIMTRKMGLTEKASTMAFYIQLTFIIVSSVIGLSFGDGRYSGTGNPSVDFLMREWIWPNGHDWMVMAAVGAMSAIGGYLISQAYRLCEAAVVAPFEYIAIPIAIIWSVLFFSEWPDSIAWIGITLIFGAGLFVFWRETVLGKKVAIQRPMPRHR